MVDDLIPEDIRDFIVRHIDSIAQLEALLLMRANAVEQWTAKTAASRLYIGAAETADVLTRLCASGFLTCEGGIFQYACQGTELDKMVGRLSELYARHLIPITNLIHAKPSRIRQFASAFKLRKDT